MTGDGPTIAIEGTREDWPRRRSNPDAARPQPRTERADLLVRRRARPGRHPAVEAVRWMREQTPGARGDRLVDVLLAWMPPDHPLDPDLNRFQVWVSDDGDTRIERYGD